MTLTALVSQVIHRLRRRLRETRLGPYSLGDKLGEGGMGVVYRAHHERMPRPVALKLVRHAFSTASSDAAERRLTREASLTSSLSHPNVIAVHDYGEGLDGRPFAALELLDGVSLDEVIHREGALSARRCLSILGQLAAGLAHVHARGIVHRDVKPANVMLLSREGHPELVKLVDFGLAGRLDADGLLAESEPAGVGTPLFMAPEAIAGERTTAAADVYAVGAVAYALLTGEYLFAEHERVRPRLLAAHLGDRPVPPSLRSPRYVPRDLEEVVLRCLEKDPAARYPDGGALLAALRSCAMPDEDPLPAPRRSETRRSRATSPLAMTADALPLLHPHPGLHDQPTTPWSQR